MKRALSFPQRKKLAFRLMEEMTRRFSAKYKTLSRVPSLRRSRVYPLYSGYILPASISCIMKPTRYNSFRQKRTEETSSFFSDFFHQMPFNMPSIQQILLFVLCLETKERKQIQYRNFFVSCMLGWAPLHESRLFQFVLLSSTWIHLGRLNMKLKARSLHPRPPSRPPKFRSRSTRGRKLEVRILA